MKRLPILFVTAIIFFSPAAMAQVKRTVDSSQAVQSNKLQKKQKKEMMKELNLSKEQKGKLKEFHQSMKQKKEGIKNDPGLTEQQKRDKLQELQKEKKQEMNSILTPEQKEKMKEQRKKRE